jgi:hypothetical protein
MKELDRRSTRKKGVNAESRPFIETSLEARITI